MKAAVAIALLLVACGHKQPTGGGVASGSGATSIDAGAGAAAGSGAGVQADAPLTEDECAQLVGHIFDLGVAEKRKTWKPEETPTDDQIAAGRDKQIKEAKGACIEGTNRAAFTCAMAAKTVAELQACADSK